MGLFDDFDVDMDEVTAAGGFDFPDGTHEFEISEALTQNGTKRDPDDTKFIIKYDLDELGTYWEWFTIAVDGDSKHPKAKQSLGYLKARLIDLGIPAASINDMEPEDLEGIQGAITLKTKKSAKGEFQNVSSVKLLAEDSEPEEEPEPEVDTKAADKAAKARVAARQAARTEKAAPAAPARRTRAAKVADEEAEEENPFG